MQWRLALVAIIAAACAEPSHDLSRKSAALVIPPGARDVQYALFTGIETAGYQLDARFPATEQVDAIEQTLRANGWARDARPGSFVWSRYVDARSSTRVDVDHWRGVWKSATGEEAEYILEFRGNRDGPLHVFAQVGGKVQEDRSTGTSASPEDAPFGLPNQPASFEIGPGDALVLCGDQGTAAISATVSTGSSGIVRWRFRGLAGREQSGQDEVRELAGQGPNMIDSSKARFKAGAYEILWSPASVTFKGDSAPASTTEARRAPAVDGSSWLQYDPALRGRKVSASDLASIDLATACR
jgi:hypothetical protein